MSVYLFSNIVTIISKYILIGTYVFLMLLIAPNSLQQSITSDDGQVAMLSVGQMVTVLSQATRSSHTSLSNFTVHQGTVLGPSYKKVCV